jgi:hypothetical protein
MKFRKAYDAQVRVQSYPEGESKTEQAFRDQVLSRNIINKALHGRPIDHLNMVPPIAGNPLSEETFHEYMNHIAETKSQFEQLPSKIRLEFENDPAKLLRALGDEHQKVRLQELGVLNVPEPEPEPKTPEPIPVIIQEPSKTE